MAYKRPDIYIEEVLSPDQGLAGVSTSVGAFLGAAKKGPNDKAILVTSFDQFVRIFGGPVAKENMYYSVRSFFQNGGSSCYIVRIKSAASSAVAANVSVNNTEGTPAALLKFKSAYRGYDSLGASGKDLKVDVNLSGRFVSNYVATTTYDVVADAAIGDVQLQVTSANGISPLSVIKVIEAVSGTPVNNYLVVKDTESKIESGAVKHYINLTASLSAAITASDSKIELLEYNVNVLGADNSVIEQWQNLSLNPDADNYIETILNDENIGSIYVAVEDLKADESDYAKKEIAATSLNAAGIQLSSDGGDEITGLTAEDIIGSGTSGMKALDGKSAANLLCIPPSQTGGKITTAMLATLHVAMLEYCGGRKDMFAILDAPVGRSSGTTAQDSIGVYRTNTLGVDSYWGALYYPHIKVLDANGRSKVEIPPSGAIAGVYSRVDQLAPPNGSVSTTPAGYGDFGELRSTLGLVSEVSASQHGDLNALGVNCIKRVRQSQNSLPADVILGGRTLSSTLDFRYINVRRMMTFVEESVVELSRPYLFKNNGPQLWSEMTTELTSFLRGLFQSGQLFGTVEEEAYFIKIDSSNNPESDMKQGILNAEIGLALMRPAEFIVFKFSQSPLGGSTVEE